MSGYEELIGKETPVEPQAATPAAEPVVEAPVVSEPAPSEVQAPPVETPAAAPQADTQEHTVPLPVLLRTRDELGTKLTAAEQRALAAERQLAAFMRKQEEARATVEVPHPLDDPDGFKASLLQLQQRAVQEAVGPLREQHQHQLEQLSKTMLVRHIGQEKFGELEQFINAAPDQAHAIAMRQADPYGWFYEKFEEAQKHRKAQAALQEIDKFGGKSIEEIVAERVAAELAKHTQAQPEPVAAPAVDTRPRNPDGTFASTSTNQTQRHQPPSLSVVAAAPAPRGEEARGGYEQLFKRG